MVDIILWGFMLIAFNFALGGVISIATGQHLSNYLKKHNYPRWKTHRILGVPLTNNPFKTFPYIYNNQDTQDKKILKLKIIIRYWMMHSLVSAMLMLVWVVVGPLLEKLLI